MKQIKQNLERLVVGAMLLGAASAPAAADSTQDTYAVLSRQDDHGTVIQYDFDGDGSMDAIYTTQKNLSDQEIDNRVVQTLNKHNIIDTQNLAYKMSPEFTGDNVQLRTPQNEVYKQNTPVYTGTAPKIE